MGSLIKTHEWGLKNVINVYTWIRCNTQEWGIASPIISTAAARCKHECTNKCVHIYIHSHTYICISVYMNIYICLNTNAYLHTYAMNVYTWMLPYTHASCRSHSMHIIRMHSQKYSYACVCAHITCRCATAHCHDGTEYATRCARTYFTWISASTKHSCATAKKTANCQLNSTLNDHKSTCACSEYTHVHSKHSCATAKEPANCHNCIAH